MTFHTERENLTSPGESHLHRLFTSNARRFSPHQSVAAPSTTTSHCRTSSNEVQNPIQRWHADARQLSTSCSRLGSAGRPRGHHRCRGARSIPPVARVEPRSGCIWVAMGRIRKEAAEQATFDRRRGSVSHHSGSRLHQRRSTSGTVPAWNQVDRIEGRPD